jgi:putative ABC transport system permease protein
MNKMIVANLVHRPVRSLISIVAIAVEVTLILVIVGLSVGMINDSKERTAGIGADVMVQPPGSSFLSGISGAPVSAKIADVLRKQPHVAVVSPVITQLSTTGALEVISGIDLASYQDLGGPFKFIAGGPFQQHDDMLIDDFVASSKNVKVGDSMDVLGHKANICGIVLHGRGARKYVQLATLQDWMGAPNKATMFYVKADDPNNASLLVQEFQQIPGMEKYVMRTLREYMTMMTATNLPGLSTFINVVIGVALVIGFIVIFQAMYTAVMERTREIGILKSLGASKLYIVNVILRETILLAICGIILGIAVSFAARAGLIHKFPLLPVMITREWILRGTVIAIVGAILGAIYPAIKAAQKDPIDALAYE